MVVLQLQKFAAPSRASLHHLVNLAHTAYIELEDLTEIALLKSLTESSIQ
jgi:hypothetical protein